MKKLILVALSFGALTMLSSPAQAHDGRYSDYDRHYSGDRYGYRDSVRYERSYRSYYYDDRPVIIRRHVIVDDCGDSPRYYRHHSGLRFFFGF